MGVIVVNGPASGSSTAPVVGDAPPVADGQVTFDASVTGQVTMNVKQEGTVRGHVLLVE